MCCCDWRNGEGKSHRRGRSSSCQPDEGQVCVCVCVCVSCSAGLTCPEVRFASGLLLFCLRSGAPLPRISPFSFSPPTCLSQVCVCVCVWTSVCSSQREQWMTAVGVALVWEQETEGRVSSRLKNRLVQELKLLSQACPALTVLTVSERLLSHTHATQLPTYTHINICLALLNHWLQIFIISSARWSAWTRDWTNRC